MCVSDRLTKLALYYDKEAHRCLKAKAFFAATVMQVAALEAMLQGMCFLFPDEIRCTNTYQKKRFRRKRYRSLEFTLKELIQIANETNWLPARKITWAGMRTDLAGFAQEIRELRNHVHPGKWARRRNSAIRFSKGTFETVKEIFDVTHDWLLHHLNKRLLAAIERSERKQAREANHQNALQRHLIGGPKVDDFEIERDRDMGRDISLS
jgi:hypothetical protein